MQIELLHPQSEVLPVINRVALFIQDADLDCLRPDNPLLTTNRRALALLFGLFIVAPFAQAAQPSTALVPRVLCRHDQEP